MRTVVVIALFLVFLVCVPAIAGYCHLLIFNVLPAGLVFFDVVVAAFFFLPLLFFWRCQLQSPDLSDVDQVSFNKWVALLWLSFTAMMIVGIFVFAMLSIQAPHGEWDAKAIWNLHARFLSRGGEHWQDYLTPMLHWSHPDYPLLLPAALARLWVFWGGEFPVIPIAVALLFTLATVALLVGGVALLEGKLRGLLAGILLLGTPNFIAQGASQYADIPLAFFFLAWTVVISVSYSQSGACRSALIFMAFMLAACAAWTKNEGLLFLLAAAVVYSLINLYSAGSKFFSTSMPYIIAGCLPLLILVIIFKTEYAPANDIMGGQGIADTLSRISEPQRYLQIGRSFLGECIRFNNGIGVLMVLFLFLTKPMLNRNCEMFTISALLALMIVGYFLVYLISPRNLYFHLGNSLDRISMQLWPTVIFWYCIAFDWRGKFMSTPRESLHSSAGGLFRAKKG